MKVVSPKKFKWKSDGSGLGGEALINEVVTSLRQCGKVKVAGLGIFSVVECKGLGERTLNGKTIIVQPYKRIKFKPLLAVKRQIHGN